MKIKSISVSNFKAISEQEIDLNGASAIITAGNNKGKSSLLRGLIDRFRGDRPDIIVKEGEEKGFNTIELTDGSKIAWSFTKKTENFSFTTPNEIKMTTGVLSAIGEKYFGTKFDIEKFLQSGSTEQVKQVQKLLGIDLTELESKYKTIYDERTEVNREIKRLLALNKQKPEPVEVVDIEALKEKKNVLKLKNDALKKEWETENTKHLQEITDFNNEQKEKESFKSDFITFKVDMETDYKESEVFSKYINFDAIQKDFDNLAEPLPKKEITSLPEPEYHDLTEIEREIEDAYENKSKADAYQTKLDEYNTWVKEGKKAREKADELSKQLEEINAEKLERIKAANLPSEFEMTDDGLLYNGLPLTNNQISSSGKYICALKLGALSLGKIRTQHFDCSTLDKNSLMEVQKWAEENDMQLLIERPSWEGGEITYEIIEEL